MNYKRQSYGRYNNKYKINNKNKSLTKYSKVGITFLIMILLVILLEKNFLIHNYNHQSSFRTSLYFKVINSSISSFGASSNDLVREEDKGISAFNIVQIIKDEFGLFNKNNSENTADKSKETFIEDFNIDSFNLKENDINKRDIKNISEEERMKNANKRVLIYHTHTCEAYSPGEPSKKDPSSNMIAVGDALTAELEKRGFAVIHDKTFHDTNYDDAYYKSRETLKRYLNQYKDFDLIIDMHRDSGPKKESVTGAVNGESVAKIMFVPATANPRYKNQLAKMNAMVNIANKSFPDLLRGRPIFDTYTTGITYYSQDLSDNAVLIEVGASTNTLSEAKTSMKYLGQVIGEALK
ncbi:stage II sporulation protein P [Clostridium sp. UBA6640]|uniref:stage II sporulation protein P n=1 Tax=Clostridium sp. UBA6640 TaxID=1946370 RepID=UPI0025C45C10|nr:stage II sporulation protein P [Clostridium sp. UBA6640]